jgi:nitrogen-specific signal transduction histidine kinase
VQVHSIGAEGRLVVVLRPGDTEGRLRDAFAEKTRLETIGRAIISCAHTLRNKLGALDNHLTMASSAAVPAERRQAALATLARGMGPVVQEISAILDTGLNRPSTDELCDLTLPLREALRIVRPPLERKGVELAVHVAPGVPRVRANAEDVERILVYLLTNAEEALERSGRVAGTIRVDVDVADGSFAEIRVTDDGGGVAEGMEGMIFEPFYTGDPEGRSFGLGLSESRRLALRWNGCLSLHNRPGEGATFILSFPPATQPARPAHATSSVVTSAYAGLARLRNSSILLVSDSPEYRDSTRVCLETLHRPKLLTDVATARAALDAMGEAAEGGEPYDVVLVDYGLPDADGRSFHRAVRRRWPDLARRVVIVTGERIEGDIGVFLQEKGVRYLSKPLVPDHLVACIAEVIAGN